MVDQFPGTDFHDLNLDWILDEITKLRAEWEAWQEAHEDEEVNEDAPSVSGS